MGLVEAPTGRDAWVLHMDMSVSSTTPARIGEGRERSVVPSHHEDDQPIFLPFPFSGHTQSSDVYLAMQTGAPTRAGHTQNPDSQRSCQRCHTASTFLLR